jgi:hypothetical protein
MFTELRTITDVTGSPPTSPDTTIQTPWASNSRFGGDVRRWGSRLGLPDKTLVGSCG